jgi:S-adenosylmethionine/arginine decarboxylase-like enzyme
MIHVGMGKQTRRVPKGQRTRKNRPSKQIEHHHLLLRIELEHCPSKTDKNNVSKMIDQIISDIHMKSLATPHVYYVTYPRMNEGLTGIAPIETSHIAFHFWTRPDKKILHTARSKCLLQFDLYTCGSLSQRNVASVLHHLTQYKPTFADITLLNRNWGLSIQRHVHWDSTHSDLTWAQWLDTPQFQ